MNGRASQKRGLVLWCGIIHAEHLTTANRERGQALEDIVHLIFAELHGGCVTFDRASTLVETNAMLVESHFDNGKRIHRTSAFLRKNETSEVSADFRCL